MPGKIKSCEEWKVSGIDRKNSIKLFAFIAEFRKFPFLCSGKYGCSSVGRALVSKTRCREFESLLPCIERDLKRWRFLFSGSLFYGHEKLIFDFNPEIEMFTFCLLCFTSFFTLINPLGAMPVFMTMTMELDEKERRKVAWKASLVSFLIIMLFAISGDLLFRFFGISINSLRIVGGIIFLIMGMDMLQARLVKTKVKESEVKSYVNDISITPLSIPMLCGPGAITNAIVMWNRATDWEMKSIMVVAVAFVIMLVYCILRGSSQIIKILGETGNNVMMRLMGLIVMVIAVEFFFSGLKPIVIDIFTSF